MNRTAFRASLLTTALWPLAAYAQSTEAPPMPASNAAAAEPAAAASNTVGEIIVTAQKRSERLQDVPLSITAATGDQLAKQGVTDVAGLEKVVPGFTYRQSQNGTPVFSIRGIGFYDEQLAVSPTVTVYVDQAPLPYGRMAEGAALDLERVEVLKGPQGTLFGENSTGGAVNYIAAKPTDAFAAGLSATYARFDEFDVGGYVSGPLANGLDARLAFRTEQRGAWQQNSTRDAQLGHRDFNTGRLLLSWRPDDRLQVQLNMNGWVDKSDTLMTQARGYLPVSGAPPLTPVTLATATALTNYPYVTTNSNRLADWNPGQSFRRDDNFYQGVGRIDYRLTDQIHIVSISAYSNLQVNVPIDADGTNVQALFVRQEGVIRSFSQEVRFEGAYDRLKWVVGADFEDDQTREEQFTKIDGSNSQAPNPNGSGTFIHFDGINLINNENVTDVAGFGNIDYSLTKSLNIQGGVRYTSEQRSFNGCLADGGGPLGFRIALDPAAPPGSCLTFGPTGKPGLYRTSFDQDNVSWRASLNWKPIRDTLLYVTVTKGYKSGSFPTVPAVSFVQLQPVTQEALLAYEGGVKSSFAHHRIDASAAIFYYDYDNKQLQGSVVVAPFGNLPSLINVPRSRVGGAEVNVTVRPITGLRINVGATYLDTKVLGSAPVESPFGVVINAGGEAFPATPRWQVQGDIEYDFDVGQAWTPFVGLGFSYRSSTVAYFGSKTGPAGSQADFNIDAYGLLDLRAGVDFGSKYRVEVFGKNVTDTQYWNNVTHVYDTFDRVTGFPATYGVTVSAKF
jgi:iron complex outermembrane receptor protein